MRDRRVLIDTADDDGIALHLLPRADHQHFHPLREGILRAERYQHFVTQHTGDAAGDDILRRKSSDAATDEVRVVDTDDAGDNLVRSAGGGAGLLVQVPAQQAGEELHEKHHPDHPEGVGNAVADVDGGGVAPCALQGFGGGGQARGTGAGPCEESRSHGRIQPRERGG